MAQRRDTPSPPDDDEVEDRSADSGDEDKEDRGGGSSRRPGAGAAQAAQAGLRQIAELTGKPPEGVTGVERGDDGWIVGVEVVEDRRVPSSADILATYEAELDESGDLLSYRRVRRYPRGRGDRGEDS